MPSPAPPLAVALELETATVSAAETVRGAIVLHATERCRCVDVGLRLYWRVLGRAAHDGTGLRSTDAVASPSPAPIEEALSSSYRLELGRWVRVEGPATADVADSEAGDVAPAHPYRGGGGGLTIAADGVVDASRGQHALAFRLPAPLGPLSHCGSQLQVAWRLEAHLRTADGVEVRAERPFELSSGAGEPYCHGTAEPPVPAAVAFRLPLDRRRSTAWAVAGSLMAASVAALVLVGGATGGWLAGAGVLAALLVVARLGLVHRMQSRVERAQVEPLGRSVRAGEVVELAVRVPIVLPVRGLALTLEVIEERPGGLGRSESLTAVATAEVPHARLEPRDADGFGADGAGGVRRARRRGASHGWLLVAPVALPAVMAPSFVGGDSAVCWQLRVVLDHGRRPQPWALLPIVVRPARGDPSASLGLTSSDAPARSPMAGPSPRADGLGATAPVDESPIRFAPVAAVSRPEVP